MAGYFKTYLQALDACPDRDGVLGDECVIHPPDPDYGYESTPRNAITFGCMGADGVHYAVLTIDGMVIDESPVVQVSPMDFSSPYCVLGDSFLGFLADGCGVPRETMASVFATEQAGTPSLVAFLRERFQKDRLWGPEEPLAPQELVRYIQPRG